jgi:ribose transport system substrate-binding protein
MYLTRRLMLLTGVTYSARSQASVKRHLTEHRSGPPPVLVNSIRSLALPYHSWWNKGGKLVAETYGTTYQALLNEGNVADAVKQIEKEIGDTRGNMVLNFDAMSDDEADQIAKLCLNNNVYFVSQSHCPPRLRPWDANPFYVAHIDWNHRLAAQRVAAMLFAAMGNKGGIIALEGPSSDIRALERRAGLDDALSHVSRCRLLQAEDARWEASVAYEVTRSLIAKFGSEIGGIWAANDDMALGAIDALRVYRLQGSVPVTGMDGLAQAIEAVKASELTATVPWDSFWQGGIGLAIAASAKLQIFRPETLPRDQRAFYGAFQIISQDNVAEFLNYRDSDRPAIDWKDLWGRSIGGIRLQ